MGGLSRCRVNLEVPLFVLVVLVLLILKPTATSAGVVGHKHEIKGYHVGQNVTFECKRDGLWVPGPTCTETGHQMTFTYGVDTFASCGWHIQTEGEYEFLASLVKREENWNCRVPMIPEVPEGHDWYVPFTIPVWGVVERDHMHIDNHLNFIFHAGAGRIIGVAAYPVRNRLQFGRTGSIITMHGPVKWFAGHTYLPFASGSHHTEPELQSSLFVLVCCSLTLMMTSLGFVLLYRFYLRKRLIQKMLKVE